MVLVAQSDRATAFEAGLSTSIYNINLVAYGYSGEGVGTTALLRNGFDTTGKNVILTVVMFRVHT